jgi:protein-S-isoprenylcysteine O-methyltransferase Ste14
MGTDERDIPGVVAPPPLIYAAGLLLGWGLQRLWPRAWLPVDWARPLGVVLLLAGLVGVVAVLAFRRAGTTPNPRRPAAHLVTGGPYRITRNPMYIGFTLWYLAASSWANALWPVVLLPLVLLVLQRGVIAREEAYLQRRFGREYDEYRTRVRRWV